MDQQWNLTSSNKQKSFQIASVSTELTARSKRLALRQQDSYPSHKTRQSNLKSAYTRLALRARGVGTHHNKSSPIKFARAVAERTRSNYSRNLQAFQRCSSLVVQKKLGSPSKRGNTSPKFIKSVCERTRSRSSTPSIESKTSSVLGTEVLSLRETDSLNTCSIESRVFKNDDILVKRNSPKTKLLTTRIKPAAQNLKSALITGYPKHRFSKVRIPTNSFTKVHVFESVSEALKTLSGGKKTLVPLVCLDDVYKTEKLKKSNHKVENVHIKNVPTVSKWNPAILDRIRKVGQLLKSEGDINKRVKKGALVMEPEDEVDGRGDKSRVEKKQKNVNGIDLPKGVISKNSPKNMKDIPAENVILKVPKRTPTKKSPKKPDSGKKKRGKPVASPPDKEEECGHTALKIDVMSGTENTNSLSPSKDNDNVRHGRRIRSPSIRYADDMIIFPLKSPRRSRSPKGNSTGASPEEKVEELDAKLSSEKVTKSCSSSQTSQLYSLLTGVKETRDEILDSVSDKVTETVHKITDVSRNPKGKTDTHKNPKDKKNEVTKSPKDGKKASVKEVKTSSEKKSRGKSAKRNMTSNSSRKSDTVRVLNFEQENQESLGMSSTSEKLKESKLDGKAVGEAKIPIPKIVSEKEMQNSKLLSPIKQKVSSSTGETTRKSKVKVKMINKQKVETSAKGMETRSENSCHGIQASQMLKAQGLFELISKVKNNMDYEKVFPGVVADIPFYVTESDENEVSLSDNQNENEASVTESSKVEDIPEIKEELVKSDCNRSDEVQEPEEIVDDFFSEDFLQMKKSPKKKGDSPTKMDSDDRTPVQNEKALKENSKSLDTQTSQTSCKTEGVQKEKESQVPVSPADVTLADQPTSLKSENMKDVSTGGRDKCKANADSISEKMEKQSESCDDKIGLLTIDTQERRNIFDAIMSDYSPRDKNDSENSPKEDNRSGNKDSKAWNAETSTSKETNAVNSEIPVSRESETVSSEVPAGKESKTLSTKISSSVDTQDTAMSKSCYDENKSIVEKIQEKLGFIIDENPMLEETGFSFQGAKDVRFSKVKSNQNEEGTVSKVYTENTIAQSMNMSKDSSDFEICMGTVDEHQEFFELDEKSDVKSSDSEDKESSSLSHDKIYEELGSLVPLKHVPKASFGRIIKEPAPLTVLISLEDKNLEKPNVFLSKKLEDYLSVETNHCIQFGTKENKLKKKCVDSSTGSNVNENICDLTKDIPEEVHGIEEEESFEDLHEDSERTDNFVRFSSVVEECDPDFTEVDGILFISFPNEESLSAHLKVEQKSKIGKSEKILLGMARMKNIRTRQKQIRQTAHKKSWARLKSLKAQFKIEQSLQGMHLVLAKYQRIYKRELVLNLLAKEEKMSPDDSNVSLQKTSDVTKIKGWRKKFGEGEMDGPKSDSVLRQKGKLHWKTEESLLKSLHPDELREYGFDLKKKRRKNLIFTIRKGMSKGDGPGSKTEKVAENLDGASCQNEDRVLINNGQEGEVPMVTGETFGGESEISFFDEERRKALERKIREKEKKYLMKKLKMDQTDIDILKKLGGQRLGRPIKSTKCDVIDEVVQDVDTKQEFEEEVVKEDIDGNSSAIVKKRRKRRRNTFTMVTLNSSMLDFALSALDRKYKPKKKKSLKKTPSQSDIKVVDLTESSPTKPKEDKDLNLTETDDQQSKPNSRRSSCDLPVWSTPDQSRPGSNVSTPEQSRPSSSISMFDSASKEKICNKPEIQADMHTNGCRYGCICHLCQSWDPESPEHSNSAHSDVACSKEYCRLGCICDSSVDLNTQEHCGKPECMVECQCLPKRKAALQSQKSFTALSKEDNESMKSARKGRRKSHDIINQEMIETVEGENDPEYYPGGPKTSIKKYQSQSLRKRGAGNSQRYSSLPKRETTYRLAKNLDAVSRKAMLVYKTSEKYADIKSKNKKRSDSVDGPQGKSPPSPEDVTYQNSMPVTSQSSHILSSIATPTSIIGNLNSNNKIKSMSQNKEISGRVNQSDTDFSLFESDSDGDDMLDTLSCARILPYNSSSRRSIRKCTCGTEHDKPCNKEKEVSTASAKIQTPAGNTSPICISPSSSPPHTQEAEVNTKVPATKRDYVPLPGWHTQWVCLKNNKKPKNLENNGIKLLEIMSNCNWESVKQKILSKISIQLQEEGYPKPTKKIMGDYWVEFLPKSDLPAVIPFEVKKNIPGSIFAVRIKIYKKLDYINDLSARIKEQEKILGSKIPDVIDSRFTGRPAKYPVSESKLTPDPEESIVVRSVKHPEFKEISTPEFEKKSARTSPERSLESSPCFSKANGISGLSRLQVGHQKLSTAAVSSSSVMCSISQSSITVGTSVKLNASASTCVNKSTLSFMAITSSSRLSQSTVPLLKTAKTTNSTTLKSSSSDLMSVEMSPSVNTPITKPDTTEFKELITKSVEKLSSLATSLGSTCTLSSAKAVPKVSLSNPVSHSNSSLTTTNGHSLSQHGVNTLSSSRANTTVKSVPRVSIIGATAFSKGMHPVVKSVTDLTRGKECIGNAISVSSNQECPGNMHRKLTPGAAVTELVPPVTAVAIDVTSSTQTSTLTTYSLPVKPTASTLQGSITQPYIAKSNFQDIKVLSPSKTDPLKVMSMVKSNADKLCLFESKSAPVTLLGPFDSPSKIPKVLPQMKVLQAKSMNKDGKPVIHLIPYTTPMSGASLASSVVSVPFTLSSITSVATSKELKLAKVASTVPLGSDVKQESLESKSKPPQLDLTTGCMFTVSNTVATTNSTSTSVTIETSLGSSITSSSEFGNHGKILPAHGDQIILLSSTDYKDRIIQKLNGAPVVDTAAFVSAGDEEEKKSKEKLGVSGHSISEKDHMPLKEDHISCQEEKLLKSEKNAKLDTLCDEKHKFKRKQGLSDALDIEKENHNVKKRKVNDEVEKDSVLAKFLVSENVEQVYAQYRGESNVSIEHKERNVTGSNMDAVDQKGDTNKECRTLSAHEKRRREQVIGESDSDDESEVEAQRHHDSSCDNKSDDTDATVAGGVEESDVELSNQSFEEKLSKSKVNDNNAKKNTKTIAPETESMTKCVNAKIVSEISNEVDACVLVDKKDNVGKNDGKEHENSMLALELIKGNKSGIESAHSDKMVEEKEIDKDLNSETKVSFVHNEAKKRKTDEKENVSEPISKRLKPNTEEMKTEEKARASDESHSNLSGDLEDEDWHNHEMCMVEDTDDMTVVIPNDEEEEEEGTTQDVDCVILDSSDEDIEIEKDTGEDTAMLLRKQAESTAAFQKATCNVHSLRKETKRKSPHQSTMSAAYAQDVEFREDPVNLPEGVVITQCNDAMEEERNFKEISRHQKRRIELRKGFMTLAETLVGRREKPEFYNRIRNSNELKLQLMQKARMTIKNMEEYDNKCVTAIQSCNARNILLKEQLSKLKDFMIKERGMPWMVLQAHLDKIAKVCRKIFQNMPAILKKRNAAQLTSTSANVGPRMPGPRGPSAQRNPALYPACTKQFTPSIRQPNITTNGNSLINVKQNQGVLFMGRSPSIRPAAEALVTDHMPVGEKQPLCNDSKKDTVQAKPKPAPKTGSAKRKPSVTSSAVYIDYAEDENDMYDDIMASKTDSGSHLVDHVNDCTLSDIGDLPGILKPCDIKLECGTREDNPASDLTATLHNDKSADPGTPRKQENKVDMYRIETSNYSIGSALLKSSSSFACDSTSSSTIVEVNMSETGKVANSFTYDREPSEGEEGMFVISEVKSLSAS